MVKLHRSGSRRLYLGSTGERLPSVTQVLKVLEDKVWMNAYIAQHGRQKLDKLRNEAAVLGTKIHSISECIARGKACTPAAELEPYHTALKEFYAMHVQRVIKTEFSLSSDRERVGGTLDLYAELVSGELAVIDLKCKRSDGITHRDRAQTAGYALLLREHGYKVQKRIVLRLHTSDEKRGRWYAKAATDHAGDVRAFRAAVELYWWRHGAHFRRVA